MPRTYLTVDENGQSNITLDENGRNKFQGAGQVFGQTEATVLGNTDWDAINNPITAFNFVLEVELVYYMPLKSIRAFTKENEYEYIREGGVNDYVHMKRKPISKPFTFQVERYIGTERFLDPLATGTELVLPLILYLYRHKARSGFTDEAPAWPARIYIFTGCTVMGKEYGELNAEKSGLVTETTTIAYRELIVIPNPKQSASEQGEWNFKDYKYPNGKGYKNKYAASNPNDKIDSDAFDYTWDKDGVLIRKEDSKGNKPAHFLTKDNVNEYLPKYVRNEQEIKSDTTYKKDTDELGNPTIIRNDSGQFNKAPNLLTKDNVNNYKPKWVRNEAEIAGDKTYTKDKDKDGNTTIKRSDEGQFNKAPNLLTKDNVNNYKAKWVRNEKEVNADKTYTKDKDKDGNTTIKRDDSGQFNKAPNLLTKDNVNSYKAKWVRNEKELNADKTYTKGKDAEGNTTIKRSDTGQFTKAPNLLTKDNVNSYKAKWVRNEKELSADKTYKKDTDEAGNATIKRDDKGSFNRPQYELHIDKEKAKYAKVPAKDGDRAVVVGPYSYKEDKTKNIAAKPAKNDTQRPKQVGPYSYKNDKTKNIAAKTSNKDSEKPNVVGPYSISDGVTNVAAAKSPTDLEKPEVRGPYSIQNGTVNTPGIAVSPKDKERAPVTTYPPSRRALMAEALKKS